MEERLFDRIAFDKGEKVRRKFREDKEQDDVFTVSEIKKVTNLMGFTYLIIYFEETGESPFVSLEFEPASAEDREKYYKIWEDAKHILDSKTGKRNTKVKTKVKAKATASKVHTFKIKDNEKD